jgi:hypothetical protein
MKSGYTVLSRTGEGQRRKEDSLLDQNSFLRAEIIFFRAEMMSLKLLMRGFESKSVRRERGSPAAYGGGEGLTQLASTANCPVCWK